jgi:hypothetical protein
VCNSSGKSCCSHSLELIASITEPASATAQQREPYTQSQCQVVRDCALRTKCVYMHVFIACNDNVIVICTCCTIAVGQPLQQPNCWGGPRATYAHRNRPVYRCSSSLRSALLLPSTACSRSRCAHHSSTSPHSCCHCCTAWCPCRCGCSQPTDLKCKEIPQYLSHLSSTILQA